MSITFKGCTEIGNWSSDDLNALTRRIESAKEQSGCSLASTMEIIEILELIQDAPENQKRYFSETADDLLTVAISGLQLLRAKL